MNPLPNAEAYLGMAASLAGLDLARADRDAVASNLALLFAMGDLVAEALDHLPPPPDEEFSL